MRPVNVDTLLTPVQAAEILQLSTHTLASWRRTGNTAGPPYIEVGGVVRYAKADLAAWLENRRIVPDA